MEAGHAGQNLYLQAEALGLATVAVGAFVDQAVSDALETPETWHPLYLFPIGQQRKR
jgi:nitroreductase